MPFFKVYTEQRILIQRNYYVEAENAEQAKRNWILGKSANQDTERRGAEIPRLAMQSLEAQQAILRKQSPTVEEEVAEVINTEFLNDR